MKKHEKLLSVTEVKNILKEKSRDELLELLIESYKTIPPLKEYISVKYGSRDNIEKIVEAYKNKIYQGGPLVRQRPPTGCAKINRFLLFFLK